MTITHINLVVIYKKNGGENCTGDLKQALTLLSPGSKKFKKLSMKEARFELARTLSNRS